MENHFECLWDLFRSIPSLEMDNASVLDEFYWLNKEDPITHVVVLLRKGHQLSTDGDFTLTPQAIKEIIHLCLMKEETLNDVKITDVFSNDFCIRISGSIGKRCSHLSHGILQWRCVDI